MSLDNKNENENENGGEIINETIPIHTQISNIQICPNIISDLAKFPSSKKTEGILFGRETQDSIIVSSLLNVSLDVTNTNILTSYFELNKFDYMRVGFFIVNEELEFFSQNKLRIFIEFQKIFPNAVIIYLDTNLIDSNCYPFKIYRISNELMEQIDKIEVDENYIINKDTIEEFYKIVFKQLNPTTKILEELKFTVLSDINTLFANLTKKNYNVDKLVDEIKNLSLEKKGYNYSLNKKINELNKISEKFIDEQKKNINYYKNNKNLNFNLISKGKGKKGEEEKFDLFEIGIQANNLKNINKKICNIIQKNKDGKFIYNNLN
jgi:hypothetical protein